MERSQAPARQAASCEHRIAARTAAYSAGEWTGELSHAEGACTKNPRWSVSDPSGS